MTSQVWEGKELFAYQISTRYLNPLPRYYYFRLLKTNVRHIEILLPVSILTYSLSSACDSALAYQILCKSDGVMTSYLFYKMAPIASQIYFRFLETNGSHVEILLPVLIFTFSLPSCTFL